MAEETLFVCTRYPSLTLVLEPMQVQIAKDGSKVTSQGIRAQFIKNSYGGLFKTSSPELIKAIRGHELIRNGTIIEVDEIPQPVETASKVVSGMRDSTGINPSPEPPTPGKRSVGAVKTPKRIRP